MRVRLLVLAFAAALTGCNVSVGNLPARATDEWVRTYPLAPGGDVQITNTNGRIEVEGVAGDMVEVRAERVAHATTETAAKELLPRITIKEDVRPDHVALEAERIQGLLIGVRVEVNYHVRAPRNALVRARATNGTVAVESMSGRVVANTTNGNISARELSGGVEARATNGRVDVQLVSVGADPVDLRTTNGSVSLAMPAGAKANLSATCTNGSIEVNGLALELMGEQSRRRVRGRLNGGGTPVELTTTNGKITVAGR